MNDRWFTMSVADIEKKMKTNAATGLSRKAARSRYRRENGNIFEVQKRTAPSLIAEIFSDFALVMLVLMSVLAVCFEEYAMGMTASVIILLNLAIAFVVYYSSEIFSSSLESFYVPNCKVIRDGKLYVVDAPHIVVGDVIMLDEGDIVACDARLVTSDNLRVQMLVEKGRYLICDKAAEGVIAPKENDAAKLSNIVHAGSSVVSGSARAIVTAVGRYTYIGARQGSISDVGANKKEAPEILKLFKKYSSKLSITLLLTILPASVLGLVFGSRELSLLTVFMTSLSVAASTVPQFALTVYRVFFSFRIRKCILALNPAVVRSTEVLDRLASVQYVFMLDGSALTDGVLHFDSAYVADGEVGFGAPSNAAKKLSELAILYDSAQKYSLSAGAQSYGRYDLGIKSFISMMKGDRDALKIRCSISGFSGANSSDMHDKLFYTDCGEKYILSVSYSDNIISDCEYVYIDGRCESLSASGRSMLRHKYRGYASDGKRVLVFSYVKHTGYGSGTDRCFVGMLAFSEHADKGAKAALTRLEAYGLKPIYFKEISVSRIVPDASRIPSSLCDGMAVSAMDFNRIDKPVWHNFGKYSTYVGFSDKDVCDLIGFLHGKGKTVAVVGFSQKYENIYKEADLFVSCSSEEYSSGKFENEIEKLYTRNDLSVADTPQVLKKTADIIIPRPSANGGGGVASLLTAFRSAGIAYGNIANFFRYSICAQLIRILICLLPMTFGGIALDARHIMLGGMVIDLFVMLSFAADRCVRETPGGYRGILKEFDAPLHNNIGMLISFGVGSLFAVFLPIIFSAFSFAPSYIDKTEYSFIVFILLHLAAFACLKFKSIRRYGWRSVNVAALFIPVFCIVMLLLCFTLEKLKVAFGIQGFTSGYYLALSFIPPVLSVLLYMLIGNLQIKKRADE